MGTLAGDTKVLTDLKQCDLCKTIYDIYEVSSNFEKWKDYEGHIRFEKLGNTKTVFDLDICPKCFTPLYDKIMPILYSLGLPE